MSADQYSVHYCVTMLSIVDRAVIAKRKEQDELNQDIPKQTEAVTGDDGLSEDDFISHNFGG